MNIFQIMQAVSRIGLMIAAFHLFLLSPVEAYASYLTIEGSSTISTTVDNATIRLSGHYTIENRGDETAQNVFPSFKLGRWGWAGEPKRIAALGKESWTLNLSFPSALISSSADASARHSDLPSRGQIPLLVYRHYSDLNGRAFSAPEVILLTIGAVTEDERGVIRVPEIAGSLGCEGDGQSYLCKLDIRNLAGESKKVFVEYHTSQELEVKSTLEALEVKAFGHGVGKSQVSNFSGLPGSSYPVFSVLQWEEGGLRKAISTPCTINIKTPEFSSGIVGGAIFFSVLLVLFMYFFVFKPSRARETVRAER